MQRVASSTRTPVGAAPPVYRPFPPPAIGQRQGAVQRADDRYNTFYTHFQTHPANQLTGTPQGPHTVSHNFVSYGLEVQTTQGDWGRLSELFEWQVPELAEVESILDNEVPPAKRTNKIRAQIERYLLAYDELYDWITNALVSQDYYDEALAAIREIMELHPYQTYAWRSGASRAATKGKKEAMHLRKYIGGDANSLKGLIDQSRAKFKDAAKFVEFIKNRLALGAAPEDIDLALS